MPLFLILFVFGFIQWCSYEYIGHTLFCLGFVLWTFLEVDWKLVLQWSWVVVIVLRLKSVEEMCRSPTETRTHVSHISGSNGPVNVRQRKLCTIIIKTVHILKHDKANTGSLPVEDFVKHSPTYFQVIQPGSSTVTPPYQWRRLCTCPTRSCFVLSCSPQ